MAKVVVGLSGGVDSAVAAYLLKKQGYDVVGLFMRNWVEEGEDGACTADEDFYDVRRVCSVLDIPYYGVDFSREYYDKVFKHFLEEYEKEHIKEITDEIILEKISEANSQKVHIGKSKSGIVVKGIDDMAVRFSKCCNPVPGDEIVGFVTRGRGMTIHRTDCVNILHLSAAERERLIDAEWEDTAETGEGGQYLAELTMYAGDRQGLLMDVSRVFTEAKIDVKSMNIRTSKKGTATLDMGFIVHGREELNSVIEKLRQIESVMDIERTAG